MYRFCQLPFHFDVTRLQTDLTQANDQGWLPHFVKANYDGDWSAIPLRSVGGRIDHIFSDASVPPEGYADTLVLERCTYFREILSAFCCPVTSVRLLKLTAGSAIKEHRDLDLTFGRGTVRLHIPISTNPQVEFYIESERVTMGEGECWYIDATLPHRLANHGDSDRVHIVFDCVVNDWLKNHFEQSGYLPRQLDFFETRGIRREYAAQVIEALRAMGTATSLRHAQELQMACAAEQ